MWRRKPGTESVMRFVEAALEHGPLDRDELAIAVGLEATGGTFSTYISRAKTAGLLETEGRTVRPAGALFPA